MPETVTSIGAYFGGSAAAGEVAGSSALAIASGTAETAGATAAGLGSASALDIAAGGAGLAGVGSTLLKSAGQAGAGALGAGAVQAALAPKRPDLPKPIPMPDAQAQEEARKRQIIEATARRGRASTILTDAASGTLGA